MAKHVRYLVDANVLMEAHRRYYTFELCPGFWDCVAWNYKQGVLSSIDRVKREIEDGKDALSHWVKKSCPAGFFAATTDSKVTAKYGAIIAWVQSQARYKPEAQAKFAGDADGWLAAYAKEHEFVVVTQEVPAPESRNEVKLPDVCDAFEVPYLNTFEMLASLKVRFTWKPST